MSESKHTSGKWTVPIFHGRPQDIAKQRELGLKPVPALTNEGQRFIMTDEEDARRVALVDCQTRFKRGRGHQTECAERDANARLIARAPTMHAALLECLEYFEQREDASNEGDGWSGNEAMHLAGVIREALGER